MSPQENRAIIISDKDESSSPTWYRARYVNCEPEAFEWDRLRDGEKVLFKPSYSGNNKHAASEVLRIGCMSLPDLVPYVSSLFAPGDEVRGKNACYKLGRELGHGAAGNVWSAKNLTNGAQVALKSFSPSSRLIERGKVDNVAHRFEREALAGAILRHPNIVRYVDSGTHNRVPFVCLEYCKGTVADELRRCDRFSLKQSVQVVGAILDGLEYLHDREIIHRDVKPTNMLMREDGSVCLGDLGIIRVEEGNDIATSMRELTGEASNVGSWFYMSPEQRRNPTQVGHRSDIYALGVSWYEVLRGSGQVPMPEEIAAKRAQLPLPHPHPINELILAMLEYDPEKRPTVAQARRCLRFAFNDYHDEVDHVIRDLLIQNNSSAVDEQTIAQTYRVLEFFSFPGQVLADYLRRAALDSPPPMRDGETGEEMSFEADGYLFELADWVAQALVQGELQK